MKLISVTTLFLISFTLLMVLPRNLPVREATIVATFSFFYLLV